MENSQLKLNAKSVLKTTYWMSFLGIIIYDIIYGVANSISNTIQGIGADTDTGDYMRYIENGDYERAMQELTEMSSNQNPVFSLLGSIVSICIALFVINILTVGLKKLFLKARVTRTADIGDLFFGFSSYGSVMKTMFFHSLYIYLWSLLFLIPGIVKSYSYYMVPYIVAENPGISTSRAFEISKKTMNGEKGKAFYMHLSFLGWYLLGLLACCIGIVFVDPYANATYAEFYAYVKQKALSTGIATPADFGEAA